MLLLFTTSQGRCVLFDCFLIVLLLVVALSLKHMNHIHIFLLYEAFACSNSVKCLVNQIELVGYLGNSERYYISTEICILLSYLFKEY